MDKQQIDDVQAEIKKVNYRAKTLVTQSSDQETEL